MTDRQAGFDQDAARLRREFELRQEEIAAAGRAGVEEIRAREAGLRASAAQFDAALAEKAEASLQSLRSSLEQLLSDRQAELQQMLELSRKQAQGLLEKHAETASADLHQRLEAEFTARQKRFDEARQGALSEFARMKSEAEHLSGMVGVDLQQQAEAMVADAVNAASAQIRDTATKLREEQLAKAQGELDRVLAMVVRQASDAGAELRTTLAKLQEQMKQDESANAATRAQIQQAQQMVASESQRLQQTVHDAFVQAAGEIRGRVSQAVEMAEEPLARRSRELLAQLEMLSEAKSDELRRYAEDASTQVRESLTMSGAEAEKALQDQLAMALHAFREDSNRLAKNSIQRWEAAIRDTLAALPQLLSGKLHEEK
jgi:hypothetical protein